MEEKNALAKADPQLEVFTDQYGHEKRVARASNGKFAKKVDASVKQSTKRTIDFLHSKANGKDQSRLEEMHEAIYQAVLASKDDPKCLVGAVKAIETLDKLAHGSKTRDRMLGDNQKDMGIRVILITHPQLTNNVPKEDEPAPSTPSFAKEPKVIDAEVISENE